MITSRQIFLLGDKSFLEVTIDLARQISKNWTACMTLSGPAHLLPNSPQTPPTCTPVKVGLKAITVPLSSC